MDSMMLVSITMIDGTETSFTIPKSDLSLPECGLMYTIRRATNPKEIKTMIIPWHQIKQLQVDETIEEDKENGDQ